MDNLGYPALFCVELTKGVESLPVMKRALYTLLLFTLPAFAADDFASALVHGSSTEVKDAIARTFVPKGWTVAFDSSYKFVLSKPTEGGMYAVSSLLLGNAHSERPDDVLTFELAPAGSGTRVVMRETISVLYADGQTHDTPVKSKKILKQQHDFLSSLEGAVALHAALAENAAPAITAAPDASILQLETGIEFERDSVVLRSVAKDSPADKGGLRAGDVVLSVNGKQIAAASTAWRLLGEIPAGSKVDLTVLRDHHPQDFSLSF